MRVFLCGAFAFVKHKYRGGQALKYKIRYFCVSDIGRCRKMNQDNFACEGRYMDVSNAAFTFPLSGTLYPDQPSMIGVFDGLGGEEQGEMASYIAARTAAETQIGEDPLKELLDFCQTANSRICSYASHNDVTSMGTTAAVLIFSQEGISLCNIGDSKIFHFAQGRLDQISTDHYCITSPGVKPQLSQNLGIPADEMTIDPYVAKGDYNEGDIYLMCSDGLTDMISPDQIASVLQTTEFDNCVGALLSMALEKGGRDNITIILCKIEQDKQSFFSQFFDPV